MRMFKYDMYIRDTENGLYVAKRHSCATGTYAPYKFCRTFGARYKCLAAPVESGDSRPRLYSRGPSARCLIELPYNFTKLWWCNVTYYINSSYVLLFS